MAYDASLLTPLELRYGLPKGILARLVSAESDGDPDAVSPKGAVGLTQLMAGTAKDMGVENPRDPAQNLAGGAKYLKTLYDQYGDWGETLAAYNAGPHKVTKGGGIPSYAKKYVEKVMPGAAPATEPSTQDMMTAPGGPQNPATLALQKEAMGALDHAKEAGAEAEQGYAQDTKRLEGIADEKLPKVPVPPTLADLPKVVEDKDYIKDPKRAMGQYIPILAMLGGLATRGGAKTALNAAASAMNAAKTNDKEALENAHTEWKDSMEKALDGWKIESDRYREALESANLSMDERQSKLRVAAALSNSRYMKEAAATGRFDLVWKALQMGDTAWYKMQNMLSLTQYREEQQKLAQQRIDDAKTNHEQQLDFKNRQLKDLDEYRTQMVGVRQQNDENHARAELMKKGGAAEAYQAAKINETKIADAAKNPDDFLTPSGSAIVSDTFTRAFNGGYAIRGFQAKMLTSDRSIQNTLNAALQKAKTGGTYTPEEISQMAQAVQRVEPELKMEFVNAAKDSIERARRRGESVRDVIPPGLTEDVEDLLGDSPSGAPAGAAPKPGGVIKYDNQGNRVP